MEPQRKYLPELTGIRALGIYAVYLTHYGVFSPIFLGGIPDRMAHNLTFGLPIFFTLSGFMIYYRYGNENLKMNRAWWTMYFRNRFARIYPVYFLCLTAMYVTIGVLGGNLFGGFPEWKETLATYTLTQAWFDEFKEAGFPQAWSLTVEETFYATAPFVFLACRRVGIFAVGAGVMLAGVLIAQINVPFNYYYNKGDFLFSWTIFGMIPCFTAGIFLCQQYLKRRIYERPLRKRPWATYGACLMGLAYASIQAYLNGLSPHYDYGTSHPLGGFLFLFATPIFAAILMYGLLTEESWLRNLLSTRLVQTLGLSAYGFYIIHFGYFHNMLINAVDDLASSVAILSNPTVNHVLRFIALNVVAYLIYRLIEKPANRYIKNLGRKRREAAAEKTAQTEAAPATVPLDA